MPEGPDRVEPLPSWNQRPSAHNNRTVAAGARPQPGLNYRQLFLQHYSVIRATCLDFGEVGLAIFAVNMMSNRLAEPLCLPATIDGPTTALIGRHGRSDLYLDEDPALSLRHLVVILEPPKSFINSEVRFRVLDCRTGQIFRDEGERKLESIVAEGPVFLQCGQYALMFLVTGDHTNFPMNGEDAWSFIPERVYLEETRAARPARYATPSLPAWAEGKRPTFVTMIGRPVNAYEPQSVEGQRGKLSISSMEDDLSLPIGEEAAHRGLLLGCYERCHGRVVSALSSEGISRVHLLLIDVAGELYAIDTGSTNGTYLLPGYRSRPHEGDFMAIGTDTASHGQRIRSVRLEAGMTLVLGYEYACLRWQPRLK